MCRIERQNGQPLPSPCPMPAPCHTTSDRREQRRHSPHVIPPRSHQPRAHTRYQQDTGHKIMYALNEASTPPHFNQEKPPIDGREDLQPLTDQEIADESSHRIHHLRSACMQAGPINLKPKQEQAIGPPSTEPRPSFFFFPSPPIPLPKIPHLSLFGQLSGTPRRPVPLLTISLQFAPTKAPFLGALARHGLRPLIPRPF